MDERNPFAETMEFMGGDHAKEVAVDLEKLVGNYAVRALHDREHTPSVGTVGIVLLSRAITLLYTHFGNRAETRDFASNVMDRYLDLIDRAIHAAGGDEHADELSRKIGEKLKAENISNPDEYMKRFGEVLTEIEEETGRAAE